MDAEEAKKENFMQEAIRLAVQNVEQRLGGPFGAVIVKNGEIIASATNRVTSANDPTAHAEVNAIREACLNLNTFDLSGCEIYASCEPCPMCLAAIYWARIDKIYHAANKQHAASAGFDDSFIYEEMKKNSSQRTIPTMQLLTKEGEIPLEIWKNTENKVKY